MRFRSKYTAAAAVAGAIAVLIILVAGTYQMGRAAQRDTETAVRSVSLLYLDELAGRREQVVAANLQQSIANAQIAVGLMDEDDLRDEEHLHAYQARMKQLYGLEKFAFVDQDGLIYTAQGEQGNIDEYSFDWKTLTKPEISIFDLSSKDKKVVIAVPAGPVRFRDKTFTVCFMEMDMDRLLEGVSMSSSSSETTFCNLYTRDGYSLTNAVLGGVSEEDSLLTVLDGLDYDEGYSAQKVRSDFAQGLAGEVSFTYQGVRETLSYVPVEGTDWLLTYLIRESVISDRIRSVSEGIILRSVIQSLLTVAALLAMFLFIIRQNRKNERLLLEKETQEAEERGKREELEQRLRLQEEILEKERQQNEQSEMITALSSDYRAVYYLELDEDAGVCYQAHTDLDTGLSAGERFPYWKTVTAYAESYVTDAYREEFLRFVRPEAIRAGLREAHVISYRYMVHRHGHESYEMVRFAGVHRPGEAEDDVIRRVGACFTDVDAETRQSMAQNQALSDALGQAEQANRAKTAFLSNMSHEIRTPMNAIIGLDSIALNDPDVPEQTRGYLEKIGDSASHLLELINDILDMSRIESGRMTIKHEEFSFSKLVEAVNTIFSGQCEEKGLTYRCRINGAVDSCYIGDGIKLRQVLINILGNAVKFTPAGGKVTLGIERTAQFEGQSTICFTVADTGIGMSPEFLPHIFDTFAQEDSSTTSRYGSSGLGMAITKNIVEMMNGTIEVESEKGKGSTFTVTLTLADAAHPDGTGAEELTITPSEMSVLIIDDDPVACEHAKLVLEKAGISSETVSSGAQAVERVRLRQARREPYDLILVDWQMPEMDGIETTRQIRAIAGSDSAIVILTAYRWDDVLEEALEAGVDSFLPKPLFAEAVLEEFRAALQRRGAAGRGQKHCAELAGRRVLLAEDMQVNAEIMIMVLQMREIEADLAENGRVAVEKFSAHEPGYYDAVLMDMRMPEMDGLEATRRIRAMDRPDAQEIPIIALTANAFDEDVQRSLQAGLNAHLSKPVQPEALFETLESLIRE